MRWPIVLAIIGIAAGVVGQATPLYLPQTPAWIWGVIFWFGITAIVGAVIWGLWPGTQKQKRWLPVWQLKFVRRDFWPYRRIVPLEQASRIAYEQTLGTNVAAAAERANADDIRGYYAIALFDHGNTVLYGTRPPSEKLEEISGQEYGRCIFVDGGKVMKRHGANEIFYDNVHIKKLDLKRLISKMKGW